MPSFGKEYSWRIKRTDQRQELDFNAGERISPLLHFSTLYNERADTSKFRLNVVQPAEKYSDAYVFCDATKVMYNMKGEPVWFLPQLPGLDVEQGVVRDLKVSQTGTITFLLNDRPYEITYRGDQLWSLPDTGSTNGRYHHEFTHDKNGYVLMGTENLLCKTYPQRDTLIELWQGPPPADSQKRRIHNIPFSTVVCYNQDRHRMWEWHTADVLKRDRKMLLAYFRPGSHGVELHDNAFCIDQKKQTIFISCKAYGILLEVDLRSRRLKNVLGDKPEINGADRTFCGQHACKLSAGGDLYLYNNNDCQPEQVPTLAMFRQLPGKAGLEKTWEYSCPVLPIVRDNPRRRLVSTGGNVMELPDKSMFAAMSSPYSNIFMVSQEKKLLWNSMLEKRTDPANNFWEPMPLYRASIIEMHQMEKMISQ